MKQLGHATAAVVGHDWGGNVAWATAIRHPTLVSRLIILNSPHPGAIRRALQTWKQLRRSWYVFFFQLPWLPEALLRFGDFRLVRQIFSRAPRRRGAFTAEDIERYVDAMRHPGALTGMFNYYRAAVRYRNHRIAPTEQVSVPTLVLWGMRDAYLGPELLEGLERWVPDLRVSRFPNASHWLQHDEPEQVAEAILGFLAE